MIKTIKKTSKHLLKKSDHVKQQFKLHFSTAIITALSLIVALTWKDLISGYLTQITPPAILSQSHPELPQLDLICV